jgi:DNA-directed RNA polymerase specialized sigma24 family protein
MATYSEKIRLLFEVDDKGSLGRLRADIAAADGVTGKFKAGIKGAGDMLKQNMAAGAMAAGAAVFTYGVKAVAAFQETALAAGKMADATGLTVEQSSRLMEVAGDLGIEVGTVQGAIQKFNNAIAGGRLDEFADSIVTAKDGSIDAYESFINTATAIGKIQDPTKRAQAAQKAFGKSYGEIAELMTMDADQLRAALDGVSDAKVIDENELRQARQFRDLLDQLKDRLDDVQLTVGERVIPRLLLMGKAVTGIADALDKIPDGGLLFGFDSDAERKALTAIGLYDDAAMAVGEVIDKTTELSDPVAQTGTDLADLDKATTSAANAQRDLAETASATGTAFHGMSKEAWDAVDATRAAKDEAGDLRDAYDDLLGIIDQGEKWDAFREAVWDLSDGAGDSAKETREWQRQTADLVMSLDEMPDEQKTKILAQIEEGDIATVNGILFEWAKGVNVPVRFAGQGSVGFEKKAAGGYTRGGLTLVGEQGPEFVEMPQGAYVHTAAQTRQMMTGSGNTTIVNVAVKADPNGTVQSLKQYERINGTRWRR